MEIEMPRKILIVDDEPLIVKGLRYSLLQDGYEIDTAGDGEQALQQIRSTGYDMLLLDVMLPGISGTELCQRVREFSNVPIIMITAKGEAMDKIMGLEYGADDYITKPFNILEVKARIKSLFRRSTAVAEEESSENVITCKNLEIDLQQRVVMLRGEMVRVTAREFDLLAFLATHRGKVYPRDELLGLVWKYDFMGDMRTVDVHIRRLREKIEDDSSKPEYILTKWGVGYYFTEDN